MTIRDLIKGSLRLIQVIATGETPSAEEQADALSVLNEMLDSWSADGLLIYSVVRESFALSPGQQVRTMGSGGNFNTTRPTQVMAAGVIENTTEIPIEVITVEEWAKIVDKSTQSTLPQKIYPEGTFPLETINIWPVPSVANSLVLYTLKPYSAVTNVSSNISFPPGYQEALRYNLARKLAPEYGKSLPAEDLNIAIESLATLKRKNMKPALMTSDAAGLTGGKPFNIYTGE